MSENPTHQTLAHVEQGSGAAVYERLRSAIAEAMTVTDVQHIRISLEQMKVHAKFANDRDLMADLMALQQRNERRLGEVLIAAREAGQIHLGGRPSKANAKTPSDSEGVLDRLTLKQAGIDWKLSSRAQKLAGVPERDFEEVVERARQKIRAGGAVVVNPAKDHSTKEKAVHRAIREAQLAERQKALPVARFGVILADPEWPFDVRSEAGKDRAAENHYPTSTLEVIAQRPVETIAADDAVLFLWVTMPHLAAGSHVAVIEAWGFTPKAVVIWDKVEAGTGYWVRNRVEALVIATRGKIPAPAPGTQWEDLIRAPKGAHSAKPDEAYELIEHYFPNLPKIELNARRRRDGWDAWGFEAPEDAVEPSGALAADGAEQNEDTDPPPYHSDAPKGAAAEGGEGVTALPADLPFAEVPVEQLTVEQQNAIITAGYGRAVRASITELMLATGLKRSAVKMRAQRLGLADPEHQREAARGLAEQINARRKAGPSERLDDRGISAPIGQSDGAQE